jgi:hypothetical protein
LWVHIPTAPEAADTPNVRHPGDRCNVGKSAQAAATAAGFRLPQMELAENLSTPPRTALQVTEIGFGSVS